MFKTTESAYVLKGPPPHQSPPQVSFGQIIYDYLLKHSNDEPAMVDAATKETISYKEILRKTCSLAESLRRNGCAKDTIISVSSENSLHFFIPVIAGLYIGAVISPISYTYSEFETVHCLNICKPKIIFCSKSVASSYIQLKKKLKFVEKIIIIDSDEEVQGAETMNGFIVKAMKGQGMLDTFSPAQFDPEEQICFILYSSGTTGMPKGVMLSHMSFNGVNMHSQNPFFLTPVKNFLGLAPFFHISGTTGALLALLRNETIVVMEKFESNFFLQTVQEYKITRLWLSPPLVVFLVKDSAVAKFDLSCIKEVLSGAAPLSKDLEEALKNKLKIDIVRQIYGMTETAGCATVMPKDEQRHGSCGKVFTYMSCKVRDPESGKSLGPGQVGELCFKGLTITKGYYRNEEATKNAFTSDGWLLTGDLGYYDEEEYFYIVDRLKEIIRYKAHEVPPAQLEALLLTHPKVKDAGVVGAPHEDDGELPTAFIVKNTDVQVTEQEIIDYVAERISPQKWLRGGVIFVKELPKNSSGKILRRELKQMLLDLQSKK